MPWKSYRKESKTDWGRNVEGNIGQNQIQLGAILRIADALETIAHNYQSLMEDRDRYKRWYEEQWERTKKGNRRESALRGVITKLKKGS